MTKPLERNEGQMSPQLHGLNVGVTFLGEDISVKMQHSLRLVFNAYSQSVYYLLFLEAHLGTRERPLLRRRDDDHVRTFFVP